MAKLGKLPKAAADKPRKPDIKRVILRSVDFD